jgi:hypothetical protein
MFVLPCSFNASDNEISLTLSDVYTKNDIFMSTQAVAAALVVPSFVANSVCANRYIGELYIGQYI